jgi:hypothetical protein
MIGCAIGFINPDDMTRWRMWQTAHWCDKLRINDEEGVGGLFSPGL